MNPERWQEIDKLLSEALKREPGQREDFLKQACTGNDELRREVDLLLEAHDRAGSFMEKPAVEATASSSPPSLIGRKLGPFEVLSLLGRGGMGEVYKVRDTRLDRINALKILPTEVAKDPDRLRRFIREAKAASALNHSNIATIYEIGESDGIHWIGMELVEGQTLAQRVKDGPLKLEEILDIGIQAAEALAEAHSKGIVHRDIKPANLMLTPKGAVKILDFGLAKRERREGPAAGADTTETHTVPGLVIGTARYMSPEQVLGRELNACTDLFSLGVVLYEMVTGILPFRGDTSAAVFDEILHKAPTAPVRLNPDVPGELERIINKALEKDREMRYQSASDLRTDLKRLKRDTDSRGAATIGAVGEAPAKPLGVIQARGGRWIWALSGLLALLLAGVGITWFGVHRAAPPTEAILTAVPLTSYPGSERDPSFSPDGNHVAFSWNGETQEDFDIYVKAIGTDSPQRLTTNPADDYDPAWSPDNRWIAFCRDLPERKVAVILISPFGGRERILTETFSPYRFYAGPRPAWFPDGHTLVIAGRERPEENPALFLLSIETHEKRKLTSPPAISGGDFFPAVSPDGRRLAFCRLAAYGNSDLYIVDLSQDFRPVSEPRQFTFNKWFLVWPAWSADGRALVFSAQQGGNPTANLWKINLSDPGKPQRIATPSQFCVSPAISSRGYRLVYVQRNSDSDSDILRMEIPSPGNKALPPRKCISSTHLDFRPTFSPDGKRVAFLSDRSGILEIWVCDPDGSNQTQLTSLGKNELSLGIVWWSPDSSRLTFSWSGEGKSEIYVINASGGLPQRRTTTPGENPNGSANPSWSRDGRWILFDREGQVCKVPAEGGPVVRVAHVDGYIPFESTDGKYIYYMTYLEDWTSSIYRIRVEGGKVEHVLDSLFDAIWPADDGIYFIPRPRNANDYSIQFLNTARGSIQRIATFEKPIKDLTVSPDRRWILYRQMEERGKAGGDLMLVENFR